MYNNYGPPSGPPPGNYGNYDGYAPPPGPPAGYSYNNGPRSNYAPPPGPPPGYARGPQVNYNNRPQEYNNGSGEFSRPPTSMQTYGPNSQMQFQYSNMSGKRKALSIGINYIGSKNALRGCINDSRAMTAFLQDKYGYKQDDMVILTDDSRDPRSLPTRENIIRAMHWLVAGAQTNDCLFLHYSGHGGQVPDQDGDEDDGYDECIYPVDFQVAGPIIDDEIHDIVVRPLPPGVRLTAVFDSCHSGSCLDLPYMYSTKGLLKEPNLAKDAGMGLLGAASSYSRGDIGGVLSSVMGVVKKASIGDSARKKTMAEKTSPADCVMISGCKDSQTSADANEGGFNTGAASYSFIEVLAQNQNQSYLSLLNNMREVMRAKYSQKPQLSCSHPLDTNLRFLM